MEFDTNWNVDTHKEHTEYEQHWQLRKSFMETHKNKYPQSRLVALSKVFANMEFMGCIYNSECMILVRNLAKQVDEIIQYWEDKKNKISRTFVKASDAVKRNKTPAVKPDDKKRKVEFVQIDDSDDDTIFKKKPKLEKPMRAIKDDKDWQLYQKARAQQGIKSKLILIQHDKNMDEKNLLFQSACKSHIPLKYHTEIKTGTNTKIHQIVSDDEVLAKVETDKTLTKDVKTELATQALTELKKYCFTIVPTGNFETVKKENQEKETKPDDKTPSDEPSESYSGIGAKIMKMMGWKGEGLGKNESGITKPIEAVLQVHRSGLGTLNNLQTVGSKKFNEEQMFTIAMKQYLNDYLASDDKRPLQFSTDFTKAERKKIHNIVQRMPLKSQSYGKGDQRALRVERKLDGWALIEDLMANGGSTAAHTLIRPTELT